MKFYFFSPLPAVCSANGEVFSVGKNVVSVDLKGSAAEIYPFGIYEKCLLVPEGRRFDRNIRRFPLYDGELVIPSFISLCSAKTESVCEAFTTVFGVEYAVNAHIDGFIKLSVTSHKCFASVSLPFLPQKLELAVRGDHLIVNAKSTLNALFVFSLEPLKCLKTIVCENYSLAETLTAEKTVRGVSDLSVREHYSFSGGFSLLGKDVRALSPVKAGLNPLLFGQAFLERARVGGDLARFLSAPVVEKSDSILKFLGEYEHVIPPLLSAYQKTYALIGKSVRYAALSFDEGGKIADIDVRDEPFFAV